MASGKSTVGPVLAAKLDRMLRTDAEHAMNCLAALAVVAPAPSLERALRDELDLLRQRVLALVEVRHGSAAIRPAALGFTAADESRRALAIEMLDVTLSRDEAETFVASHKVVLAIGGGIHASEVGATQSLNELLYTLAT